jgi:deazaflavin-dependent oxidoreductase (nitroreductase family)
MALMEFAKDHVDSYIRTDGEIGHLFDSRPFTEGRSGFVTTLLLKVKGRKSGKDHIFPLQYMKYGSGYLVVASNGGNDQDPNWLLNLRENIVAVIQVKDKVFRAPSYILPGQQRNDAWAALIAEHPWFVDYQKRTERQFPLVLLTPIDPLESIVTEAPLSDASRPPIISPDLLHPDRPTTPWLLNERLQRLLDKDEIYECWLKYCRGVDRCDADLMRQAYHEDAFEDHGGMWGRPAISSPGPRSLYRTFLSPACISSRTSRAMSKVKSPMWSFIIWPSKSPTVRHNIFGRADTSSVMRSGTATGQLRTAYASSIATIRISTRKKVGTSSALCSSRPPAIIPIQAMPVR